MPPLLLLLLPSPAETLSAIMSSFSRWNWNSALWWRLKWLMVVVVLLVLVLVLVLLLVVVPLLLLPLLAAAVVVAAAAVVVVVAVPTLSSPTLSPLLDSNRPDAERSRDRNDISRWSRNNDSRSRSRSPRQPTPTPTSERSKSTYSCSLSPAPSRYSCWCRGLPRPCGRCCWLC